MISRACLSARHSPLIETSSPIFSTSARIRTTDLTVARARSRRASGTWWEDFDRIRYGYGANYQTPGDKVSKGREAIRLLASTRSDVEEPVST